MRPSFPAAWLFAMLALCPAAVAQLTWNFSAGTGAPVSLPANITGGTITAVNSSAAIAFNSTSPSDHPGASGGNNASLSAKSGDLNVATSTYIEFTLTPASGFVLQISGLSLGSRSSSTGPTALKLYSSTNGFAAEIGSANVTPNSTWALVTFPAFTVSGTTGSSVTFRVYGVGGSSTAQNWRVDDVSANATALPAPTITSQPSPQTVTFGQSATFSVAATGTGPLSYQWRRNGSPLLGNTSATTASLTLPSVTGTDAGNYDVVVTDAVASATSATATLTVNKAAATVMIAAASATYDGTPKSASATTSPAGLTVIFTYTATSGTVYGPSSTPPTAAGTYSVHGDIADANYTGSSTSASGLIIHRAPATITFGPLTVPYTGSAQPVTATTSPAGLSVSFTYDGSPTPPSAAGSYAVTATITDPNYVGTATNTYTIAKLPATITIGALNQTYDGQPRAVTVTTTPTELAPTILYSGAGYGPSATAPINAGTYSVSANVNTATHAGTQTATLTVAKRPQTIDFAPLPDRATTSGSFTLSATAGSGLPVSFAIIDGSPGIATLAGNRITLTGATGSVTVRATQPGDANHLAAAPVDRSFAVVEGAGAPVFIQHPAGFAGHIGDAFTLSATVSSYQPPVYQWKKDGADIPGANSPTLVFTSLTAADTGLYTLVAANPAGTAWSIPAALAITKRPQTITFTPEDSTAAAGSGIVLAARSSSGLPVTLTIISGAATLTGNHLVGTGGDVIVRASQAGDDTFAEAMVQRTYTFIAGALAPVFTTMPANQTVVSGTDVTLRAAAIGTPAPSYHWQKDGSAIAGATAATLVLPNVSLADAARYTIVASNSSGTASASAVLTVHAPPAFAESPTSRTVAAGTPITLAVRATGTPAPALQWRKNGTAIAGATGSTFAIANPVAADSGRYDVTATNVLGTATSAPATLTITTRDFAGQYFGRFSGAAGSAAGGFALHVRADGTAVLLGHLPGLQTGVATSALRIEPGGGFALNTVTLAGAPEATQLGADPAVAAAPQPVTLRGTIDDASGVISGTLQELGLAFTGSRAPAAGPAAAHAGYYQLALVGSASARGQMIVAPDGQTLILTATGAAIDGALATLGADGRLAVTTATDARLELAFNAGAVSGTVRAPGGATGTIAGAIERVLGTEHLVNLSVRSTTAAAAPLITGFVVSGSSAKQVLIRAAGPALAGPPFNVPGTLADPTLQVFRGNTSVGQNDDWNTPAANATAVNAAVARAGAFPFRAGSNDAALVATLQPAAYTVVIGGGNGAVLAEIYEVLQNNEQPGARRLVNVSARGLATPAAPVIAGFVIGGTAPQRVLIRGVGPALARGPFNLAGTLANPQLTLFRGNTVVKTNDDWFRDPEAALIREAAARSGAFALAADSLDAAMLLYLEPGAYTAQVSGPPGAAPANATGIALVEVYEASP